MPFLQLVVTGFTALLSRQAGLPYLFHRLKGDGWWPVFCISSGALLCLVAVSWLRTLHPKPCALQLPPTHPELTLSHVARQPAQAHHRHGTVTLGERVVFHEHQSTIRVIIEPKDY